MNFSVIVPVYNCIGDLPACVNSILQQTCSDFELLLVDDGSSDGSGELCEQLAAQDSRIRVFHKANGGASSARNFGLKHAVGDYILFVDGDDTIESDLLEQVALTVVASPAQMLVFGMFFDSYSTEGHLEKSKALSIKHTGYFSKAEFLSSFSDLFDDNALSSACNKVFSGQVLRNSGLLFSESMSLYEDLEFVLRYLPYCSQIQFMGHAFYHYRLPPETTFVNARVLHLNNVQRNLESLIQSGLLLQSPPAAQKLADLCVQVFDMHLLSASHTRKEMPIVISEMLHSSALNMLSEVGITPSPSASLSWPMILDGSAQSLYTSMQKRKLICNAKQIIKPALKRIGLYH